jgi:hypothetical protein
LVPATILSQRYPEVKILNRRSTARARRLPSQPLLNLSETAPCSRKRHHRSSRRKTGAALLHHARAGGAERAGRRNECCELRGSWQRQPAGRGPGDRDALPANISRRNLEIPLPSWSSASRH